MFVRALDFGPASISFSALDEQGLQSTFTWPSLTHTSKDLSGTNFGYSLYSASTCET